MRSLALPLVFASLFTAARAQDALADSRSVETTGWTTAQLGMPSVYGSAFGASTYVLVGDYGEIWTSQDATAWTRRTNPDPHSLRGLTYGGGQFLGVGGVRVLRSPNGISWTSQVEPLATSLYGVTYGNGQYVAVGLSGLVLTSPDGSNWTQRASNTPRTLNDVAYGGGLYVAVGEIHEVITSPSGVTWTVQGGVPASLGTLYGVTWAGGVFVAAGSGGLMTSTDGATWTQTRAGFFQDVTYTGSLFVAAGTGNPVTSPDGTNWTDSVLTGVPGVSGSFFTLTSGGAGVVGAGFSGMVFTSPDGAAVWTSQTLLASRPFFGVASDGIGFCAVGTVDVVARSSDGITWTNDVGGTGGYFWSSLARGNGLYLAAGDGVLMSSLDCVSWADRSLPVPPGFDNYFLDGIAYGGGRFVAVGQKRPSAGPPLYLPMVVTSASGISWAEANPSLPTNGNGFLSAVTWGNGTWVAAGTNDDTGVTYIITSPDGLTWTQRPTPAFNPYEHVRDVAYGNGLFALVGDQIWTSPDGIAWTLRLPGAFNFNEVTYGLNQFVAVGATGAVYSSPDGIAWSPEASGTVFDFNGVAYSPALDRFVAVGPSVIKYAGGGLPTASVGDASKLEGDSGTTLLSFPVTLSAPYAQTVAVAYATTNGTAQAGSDYTATSSFLLFPPGSTLATIDVPIIGDTVVEADETFFVNLTSTNNAILGDALAQGTIINDDIPTLSAGDAYVVEGSSGSTSCDIPVTLSGASTLTVTVSYQTANGSATAGSDYTATAGSLTFPPSVTAATISVPVNPDTSIETDEDFSLSLSAPTNATLGDALATCVIQDDDAPSLSQDELTNGSRGRFSLAGGAPSYFRLAQKPHSSYEVVVDGVTADIAPVILDRLAANNATVLQTAAPISGGSSLSLRWTNGFPVSVTNQTIRVRSGGCNATCDAADVFQLRSYDTTYGLARYNNSGTQITVVILQNGANHPVAGTLWFWNTPGTLAGSSAFNLAPHGILSLNTSSLVPGTGGTITVSNDGGYGELSGKAVAIEPATGFTFDTPLLARPK